MQIITGKTGSPHVSAEHDRAKHAATYGTGAYVLNVGSQFAASVEPTNTIRIADGDGMMQGTHFRIPHGDYDDVIINNGSSGYIRKDLIVARYTRSGDIENVQLAVLEGEPSASDPQVKECTQGDILNGEALAEMPLYEVTVDCTTTEMKITVSEPLFTVITGLDDVYRKDEMDSALAGKAAANHNHDSAYYKKIEVDSKVTAVKTSFNQSVSVVQRSNNSILPPYGGTIGDYTITATVPANTKTVIPVLRSLDSTVYLFHGISASVSGTTATVTLKLSCTSTGAISATAIVDLFCFKTV